ncbi:serine/threonine-protein kinase [Streptomyces sp. NPDC005438]|uniref:serine/threonine-protein kinase n=1 Tax=Streptomyces sp. NPDC005438 TaxID=3156880 RepID=UPI00339E3120
MGRKIGGQYTAHQILGRGSAGTVWLGDGPRGPVAIKLLREDLAGDQELVTRFVRERDVLLSLSHPRVVGVHDLVVDGTELALVMDLVRGTDLRTRLERDRRLAPATAVAVVADVADALAEAHRAGVVHRDVKPENVLLDSQAAPGPGDAPPALLTDFGVAKLIDSPSRSRASRIIGTPDYLAPELVEGLPPRASVDIYALATVLYELLAGFTPFGGGHPGAVLRRHVTEAVAPLPGVPDELWRLIHQCLAKAPASRLRAAELSTRLREMLPELEGMPPLDIDDLDPALEAPAEPAPAPVAPAPGEAAPRGERPGAVSLVPGHAPDSNRDTHTSMRVPGADELAGGAHGTARTPRASGQQRPGSARHRAAELRRRRVRLGVVAAVLVALGLGSWMAFGEKEDEGAGRPAGVEQGVRPSVPARG